MMGMNSPLTELLSYRRLLQAVTMSVVFLAAAAAVAEITLPGCPDKCGDMSIPYPFGTKSGCFLDGFLVTCNYSFQPPRLFLNTSSYHVVADLSCNGTDCDLGGNTSVWPVELMDISLAQAEARAYGMVRSSCYTNGTTSQIRRVQVTTLMAPFVLAAERNALTGVGKRVLVDMRSSLYTSGTMFSCLSDTGYNLDWEKNGLCAGMGCCQAAVPPALGSTSYFGVGFTPYQADGWLTSKDPCSYGMVVETSWYNFSTEDMYGVGVLPTKFPRGVPFVIDFAIRNGSCPTAGPPPANYACRSGNSSCASAANGVGYICKCWEHYDGNPYIPNGCQEIDECALRDQYPELRKDYPCSSDGICVNRLGGYDCPCKRGMRGDGKAGTCTDQFPLPAKVAVGVIGGLFLVAIFSFVLILLKEKRKMREFFIKNGGPILERVKSIQIFKKDEIKIITRNYSDVLGKGNFGVVYKGFINDKVPVAVKKSNKVDDIQKEQFANEVIIQSQVIHKNIVRLLGCCLEVDVPILVYEFVPKGSLEDILHGDNKSPLTLNTILSIAAESAEGLAYMHCKTSTNIQHGDVKPGNILLDENFTPKISDFGISKLLARGKIEHADNVIGDNNYMDPVYRKTGLLTNKSDVYSFGIVLFELITGKKAAYGGDSSFIRTYLDTYITGIRESRAKEMFDMINDVENDIEELNSIVGITKECLNSDVNERPEMTDIAERLQSIIRRRKK